LGMISSASLLGYFVQKGATEEEAKELAKDVYRGKGLGMDQIRADMQQYRSGALSGSQLYDKGYNFFLKEPYMAAQGGRVGLYAGTSKKKKAESKAPGPHAKTKLELLKEERPTLFSDTTTSIEGSPQKKKYTKGKAQGGRIGYQDGTEEGMKIDTMGDMSKEDLKLYGNVKKGLWKLLQDAPGSASTFLEMINPFDDKDIDWSGADMSGRAQSFDNANKTLVYGLISTKNKPKERIKFIEEFTDKYDIKLDYFPQDENEMPKYLKDGGRIGKYGGGVTAAMPRIPTGMPRVNAGGITELDYRQEGGYVPMGVKEKADDVPAMLSKNEFVMTADAVKGAGGGSVEKGAQRMYDTMKRLEGRVA